MKKLVLLGFAILLFTACEKRYTETSPEIDVVKALIEDYETGDWVGWRSHYSDTAKSYHNTKDGGVAPDVTLERLKTSISGLSSYKFQKEEGEIEMVVDDKGRTWVNYWGVWQGSLTSAVKPLVIPVHLSFQMVDSKVVREYGYWDNAPRMKAEMDMATAREVKSAVMTKDGTTSKDGTMKKEEPKKKVAKNKDATMKKN